MTNIKDLPLDIRSKFFLYNGNLSTTKKMVAKLAGVESGLINLLLQKIADNQKAPHNIFEHYIGQNYVNKSIIPYQLVIRILTYFYYKGKSTEDGCKIVGIYVEVNKTVVQNFEKDLLKEKKPEKRLQIKLAKELNGVMEVPTEAGRIDLLTPTEIIEIKQINQWKSALGQILVYGCYYPSHRKRIYLFGVGDCHSSYLNVIKKHCQKFNVTVTTDFSLGS